MIPVVNGTPPHELRSALHHAGEADLDTKIVILSVITIFIDAYLCTAVALLAAAYALANREKRQKILAIPHVRWIFLFSILLFAIPPIYSNWLGLAVGFAIFVIFVFYLYVGTVMTKSLFNAVVDLSCLISLIYVLIALFQRLLGMAPRSPSTFQNANYYSYAIELVMVMSFYRLATARTWNHKAFILLVIAANTLALWTADSRSAWPSVFCGLAAIFVLNHRTKSMLALIGLYIAGIKLALSFPSVFPRLGSLEFAESIRTDIWLQALGGIQTHLLFGAGTLGYRHIVGGQYPHAHNLLLEMLISFGFVGTLFLSAYFIGTLRDIAKRFKASSFKQIYALVLAAIAVTVVHGIGDVTVLWPQTGMLLALILAGGGIKEKLPQAKGETALGTASPAAPES
jgi:O-antigen ligase